MSIYYIVLYKFKPEATQEQREYIKMLIKELPSKISALQKVITGEKVPHLEHGYDIGVIFLFESKDKVAEFRSHHVQTEYRALSIPYIEDEMILDMDTA